MKIAEDTAAAATSDVPYAKERVAMMLTILKRFMVQAGASGKYLYNAPSTRIVNIYFSCNKRSGSYKVRCQKSTYLLKGNHCDLVIQLLIGRQKGPKSDFQSEFSISRIFRTFLSLF